MSAPDTRRARATTGLAGVMGVLAAVVLVQAWRLDNGGAAFGPATVPTIVGLALLVTAGVLGVAGVHEVRAARGAPRPEAPAEQQHWLKLAAMVALLVGFGLVVPLVGYVVAATALFALAAVVLGAPYRVRAVAYGLCVACLVFLVFDVFIGIALPAGPWGF